MKTGLRSILTLIILCTVPYGLKAQEYREASHACFNLEEERVIALEKNKFIFKKEWAGKQVFVRVPGSTTPYSLVINDFPLGNGPGNGVAAEYNIIPFLNKQNTLDLIPELMEGNTSAISTLPTGTSLLIRNAIHARDLIVTCHPGADEDETLIRIDLILKSYMVKENRGRSIHMELFGPGGESILRESRELKTHLAYGQETEIVFDLNLKDPSLWLPGAPNLYEVKLALLESGSQSPEQISTQFAIKSFWHNDSLLVQKGDTIVLQYPSEDVASSLPGLPEQQIREISKKLGFNTLRVETPLPCHLESVFFRTGILVLSGKD